jgi:hypothetical protein
MGSRRIGSSKVHDHNIVFTSDDIALSTSDRLHGTTPALLGLDLNGDEAVSHPCWATVKTRSWSPIASTDLGFVLALSREECQCRPEKFLPNKLLIYKYYFMTAHVQIAIPAAEPVSKHLARNTWLETLGTYERPQCPPMFFLFFPS